MKRTFWACLFICLFTAMPAQTQTSGLMQIKQDKDVTAAVNFEKQLISVTAYGRPDENRRGSLAEKLIFAMTEARAKAYVEMAAYIEGIAVDGARIIKDNRLYDARTRLAMTAMVKNAREIERKRHFAGDGSVYYTSTLAIFCNGSSGINRVLIPRLKADAASQSTPQYALPGNYNPPSAAAQQRYTGLVIDAGGLGLRPALAPRILAEDGKEIYGMLKIDSGYAIEQGVVAYTDQPGNQTIQDRVGDHPLVIKAIRVSGVNRCDVVLSDKDAGLVLWADQIGKFLKECRVAFCVQ